MIRALRNRTGIAMAIAAACSALPAAAAFTDNGDGTITDTVTQLMWVKCSYGQSASDCSGGSATRLRWNDALLTVVALNGTGYKGHSDWRLPNIKELESLVQIDQHNLAIDGTAFPNTDPTQWYWSSTLAPTGTVLSGAVWGVSFNLGDIGTIDPSTSVDNSFLRVVRGGQPGGAYDLLVPGAVSGASTARAAPPTTGDGTLQAAGAEHRAVQAVAAGLRSFAGATASATGTATARITSTNGGEGCGFVGSAFVPLAAVEQAPPAGLQFPHGLANLQIANCAATGASVTVTLTFPQPLPPETRYWKYGPVTKGGAARWYVLPGATVAGNTITFTLTDGQLGDDDWTVDGKLSDPGGPGLAAAAPLAPSEPIPVLDGWPWRALLAALVTLIAVAARGAPRHRAGGAWR